ncbi:hypothetical protein VM1G_01088 [Cytospora mali]|uniref:Uncharacterized protein n=1 Tax=Cytospora mali TaxID=578113 RepID=A0A194VKK2_CYTMA|nr:hypothetical protein VM1G_01088 [Valsa mali]
MRRFRDPFYPSTPSHLRRSCVGPNPWSSQKRSILEQYPKGVIIQKKNKPTKAKFPTFELPDIVLDLDAEDSPYVRPFRGRDAVQQRNKWKHDPAVEEVLSRVGKLRKDIARDGKMMSHQATRHHTLQTISDYDVFAIALFGGSNVSSSLADLKSRDGRGHGYLPSFNSLRTNGIPERILAGDANKVIPFMLHRMQLSRTTEDTGDLEVLNITIQHLRNLGQLRKLCFGRASASSRKIYTSHDSIDNIVQTLRAMHPQPPEDILKFINNFNIRQLSEKAGLNASMSLYGLETASRLKLLLPIMQYLQICLSQGFKLHDDRSIEILETVGHGILGALEEGQGTAWGTRPELFALLTGHSLANSELRPALFGLDMFRRQEDPRLHLIYVRLLAELGALRLLWYSRREDLEEACITAFIRCVQVLSCAKGDASVDYTSVTGDLEGDAYLDLCTIDSLDAYRTSVMSTEAPSASNIDERISLDEVRDAYKSTDIHQAMTHFEQLISRVAV